MAEYRDPTPITPNQIEYDQTKVDSRVKNYTKQIREKQNGLDVREAMARNAEIASIVSVEANDRSKNLATQFQNIIDETTGKDVISAPELIAARNGEVNLKARLDKENNETKAQLAQNKLNDEQLRAYVDLLQQQVTNMGDISPSPFGTVAQLKAAYPNGNNKVYVVTADGNWYYWNSSEAEWSIGGTYQASGIADGSITLTNLEAKAKRDVLTNFAFFSDNAIYINYQTTKISFAEASVLYYPNGRYKYFGVAPQPITKPIPKDKVVSLIYLPKQNLFDLLDFGELELLSDNYYTIGVFRNGNLENTLNDNSYVIIDANGKNVKETVKSTDLTSRFLIPLNKKSITVDFINGTISIKQPLWVTDTEWKSSNVLTDISIPFTDTGNTLMFVFDYEKAVYKVLNYNESLPKQYGVVAFMFEKKVISMNQEAFVVIDGDNELLEESFFDDNTRFIIPKTLYLVENIPYGINSSNLVNKHYFNETDAQFEIVTPTNAINFYKTADINIPYPMLYRTRIVAIGKNKKDKAIYKRVDLSVSSKTKIQKSPKIIYAGDSLVEANMPYLTKWWLTKFGLTPQMYGTMDNSYDFGLGAFPVEKGEGRGSWRLTDLTGVNTHDGQPIPPWTEGDDFRNHNPFINPNTGNFDFTHYAITHGFEDVEYVIFAYGTNDITNGSVSGSSPIVNDQDVISNMKTEYQKIIESVHLFNPNIKIALVPPIPAGIASEKMNLQQPLYAEEMINTFENVENVYVLGNYLSSGLYAGKYIAESNGTLVTDNNETKRFDLSSNVHDSANNQYINALWSASWIMNMIS